MQVFLSYASTKADQGLARALAAAIRCAKLSPWLDEERLPPGLRVEKDLRLALEQSEAGIFLVSGSWLESKWCRWELDEIAKLKPPRVLIAVLRQPRAQLELGPDLTGLTYLEWLDEAGTAEANFWRLYCGLTRSSPGVREEWAARGGALCGDAFSPTKLPVTSDAPPSSVSLGPHALISNTCDRTKHWGTIVTHATLSRHEVLVVYGPRGFGHKQLLTRIAQDLTTPPRVVKEVSWGDRRPATEPDLLELLLHGLSDRPAAAGDLHARVGDLLHALLATRNVVLLHPPVRGGFDRQALVDYYATAIPKILGVNPTPHHLKCVQPVEWIPGTPAGRVTKGLSELLGAFPIEADDETGEQAAQAFIGRLKSAAASSFPVTVLPVLGDVPGDELMEFLERQDLTERQRKLLLTRVMAVAATPDELFKAIDDYFPEVRGSAP